MARQTGPEAELLRKLKHLDRLKRYYSLFFYKPYPKQEEFHALAFRERLLLAGNRLGKTMCAGAEVAFHMTGLYPDWWVGRRFTHPPRIWIGSVTAELTRDGAQRVLLGPANRFGAGLIPRDRIAEFKKAKGISDAIDTFQVKHVSGDNSQATFKSYKDGREAWQADEIDLVWLDEEPPEDVYTEALTRTNNTGGCVMMTFTPLMGMTRSEERRVGKECRL